MSSPAGSVRQRGTGKDKKRGTTPQPEGRMNGDVSDQIENLKQGAKEVVTSEWDYKVALVVITILAFITRFYGITHPDQVVFDEVHFGKVNRHNHIDAMFVDIAD
jgi:dolichyl-phosphate-mannose-protein mannosyltransferase